MGPPWKFFHWLFVPKFFPGFSTYILTPKKNLGEKPNVKFFTVARYFEVIFFIGLIESVKNETFCLFWPRRGCPRVKIKLEPLSIWGEGYLIQRRWNFDPPGPHKIFFRKKTCHSKYFVTYTYVKVTDQSNIAMFWVKKLISQPTVPAEPPFFEQIILTP